MKAEVLDKVGLVHNFLIEGYEKIKEAGVKKISKFIGMCVVYLLIVWTFDYLWIPWLAIKFRYLTFFPLYGSLCVVCLLSLCLYNCFKEDIFFKKNIQEWLAEDGKNKFTRMFKKKINSSPGATFAAISTWWSPLHSYIYFRAKDEVKISEAVKLIAIGSFYCSFFWGVVVFIVSALWDLTELIILHL